MRASVSIPRPRRAGSAGWGVMLALVIGILTTSPATAATSDSNRDVCAIISADDVLHLITSETAEIRSTPGHPAPGETTCVWSAHQAGLTADAPPIGSVSLALYVFANADKAKAQMHRLAGGVVQPPSLVRTPDADDQIVRPNPDGVIARHGAAIAVVDASEARDFARQHAGWIYRLEVLALQAVGAQAQGPASDRAVAAVCDLIAPERVLPLLTLTRSALKPMGGGYDDGKRCSFSVKDASSKIAGWVNNHGDASFTREDLGTNAEALARQHRDWPFFPPSNLVPTADATDRVVANPEHPEEVEAVHGPFLITLHLTGVTPEAQAHPSWTYRVQRTALEAAGATIVARADLPPDPVVAGPIPPPPPVVWQPLMRGAPAGNALIDPLLHASTWLARWRFLALPVAIVLPLLLRGLGLFRFVWPIPLFILLGVANLLFGTELNSLLIYRFGAAGRATITGSYATSTQYNNHNVRGHNVLIRTADGQVVETSFEDDDFNIYPPHNRVTYPGQGDEFSVRYVQTWPKDFIIVADDDSPWAHGLRCAQLRRDVAEAGDKRGFAPDSADYRKAYTAAVAAARAGGCEVRSDDD